MNFPTFINKWIISNRFLRYTPFWWWYRLMSHQGFRFDDYHIWGEFWHSLNSEWEHMEYVYKFEKFWGEGSYPPEKIILSKQNYDALVERLNEPPDPKAIERLTEILRKPAPWDE
jgi:hypothetical protein